ncbi:putative metalloprotease CJM1_0395 family protein [Alkalimarinus sediminis]|uniref:Catalase n=1 Tax=Alkalimarinus sediminis TaxID=1632866 RepID=A0A9E8HS52_9ALTE|nr:putative metalloprotease CJM1_0395 family protein [Alkalimarinus sediminis]UZW75506.1 hypothetical protein NNL22_02590 [Alkalimarinus sediminis]
MQISNASVPFPNAVAPFTPKVDQPGSGVTKDILVSSFAPLSETQSSAASQNSLSEKAIVYSPQSLAQARPTSSPLPSTLSKSAPKADTATGPLVEASPDDASQDRGQPASEVSRSNLQPSNGRSSEGSSADGINPITEDSGAQGESAAGATTQADAEQTSPEPSTSTGLSPEEREIVGELAARDREVRTHEQQHQSVGGQYAGAASFSYQTGPDGVQYAVGGEVSIDISPVPNNPQATIDKMRTVKNAALAPAEPSAQDRSVASSANRIMMQAQAELASERAEEFQTIREETQQRQADAVEAREQQQDEQEESRPSISEGVRAYESLIELGQQYKNGLAPEINLDEIV